MADPARRRLLVGSLLVAVGAFLPWVMSGVGNVSGARGAGLFTFYVSALGIAGALVPSRLLAGLQAAVVAVVAVGLACWQVVYLGGLVGFSGWLPGPGVVLTVGGGVLSGIAARELLTRLRAA